MLFIILLSLVAASQDPQPASIPFASEHWNFQASQAEVQKHLGRDALRLQGGMARLDETEFTNGVIEFKISFGPARGFSGVAWRIQSSGNYEDFYLRPHQSGNPDACQYTPVFNGLSGWQLYHGEGYSKALTHAFDRWMQVRLVVAGSRAEVFIDDMSKPALHFPELKREVAAGGIALVASSFSPAWFADFRYRKMNEPELLSTPIQARASSAGTIMSWSISPTVSEKTLSRVVDLDDVSLPNGDWQDLACERTGLANLARVQGIGAGKDSAFARVLISAEIDLIKRLEFGYSDRARVYLNGQLLYSGSREYQSRDYRYLGSIGFFDALYLPLIEGENELLILVSEGFGGWGLQARFENPSGIEWH
ncbi:MAG: hypothetical protein ACYTG5_17675 [Planctomycetota bacterium]|jgi:hypothetical protein